MSELLSQLTESVLIVRRNKQLEDENAFLRAQNRLLAAKLMKERTQWPINDLNAKVNQ